MRKVLRSLVYLPTRLEKAHTITQEYPSKIKEIDFRTLEDNTHLVSYWLESDIGKEAPTILYLQGNQGNIVSSFPFPLSLLTVNFREIEFHSLCNCDTGLG